MRDVLALFKHYSDSQNTKGKKHHRRITTPSRSQSIASGVRIREFNVPTPNNRESGGASNRKTSFRSKARKPNMYRKRYLNFKNYKKKWLWDKKRINIMYYVNVCVIQRCAFALIWVQEGNFALKVHISTWKWHIVAKMVELAPYMHATWWCLRTSPV